MREAGRLVAQAHAQVAALLAAGVSTLQIDLAIRDFVLARGGRLLFYKHEGFPANTCISINDEVVHGIPAADRRLENGDLVSVDIGVGLEGYCGDSAWTYAVGGVSDIARRLLDVGETSLMLGIAQAVHGRRVSDIGRAIQGHVESNGFSVVKKYVGHGIGRKMHEPPQIPNYVDRGFLKEDPKLQIGMALAIEPMVTEGREDVRTLDDGWTVVTRDGKLAVHFEHTVAITDRGPEILTRL